VELGLMFVPREEKVLHTAGYIYKSTHTHTNTQPKAASPTPPCEFRPDNLKIYAQKVWSGTKWILSQVQNAAASPFLMKITLLAVSRAAHKQKSIGAERQEARATKFVSGRETRNNFARRTWVIYGEQERRRAYNSLAHKSLWK
jgi:hypothetical protein